MFLINTHIADFFQSIFGQTWLNPTTLSKDIGDFFILEHYGHTRQAWPHPRKKITNKFWLPWISYYMQKVKFLLHIVFEIIKFKKLCNLIAQEHF